MKELWQRHGAWAALLLVVILSIGQGGAILVFARAAQVLLLLVAVTMLLSRGKASVTVRLRKAAFHVGGCADLDYDVSLGVVGWVRLVALRAGERVAAADHLCAWRRGQVHGTITLSRLPRGVHRITIETEVRDLFQLAGRTASEPETLSVTVWPRVVTVSPAFLRPAVGAVGFRPSSESPTEAAGARPWRPGDRLAWVHWPATARLGEVQVREATSFGPLPVWLWLDLAAEAFASHADFELAVSVTASLVLALARRQAPVALLIGTSQIGPVPDVRPMLDALARVHPGVRQLPFFGERDEPLFVVTGSRQSFEERFGAVRFMNFIGVGEQADTDIVVRSLEELAGLGARQRAFA